MARKERRQFTLEVLDSFCKEHNIIYDAISDDVNINRDTRITGLCLTINCESKFTKSFSNLINIGGAYCTECAKERGKEKKKRTNMEKFGVEHCFQSKELRQKAIASNIEKYGVEHPSQSEEVKHKIIITNTEKYGGHPSKSEDVKQKIIDTNTKKYGGPQLPHVLPVKMGTHRARSARSPFRYYDRRNKMDTCVHPSYSLNHSIL